MNGRQLAQIGLGLLGVWALLTAVSAFIQIAAVVASSLARLGLAEALPVALMLGLSYLLIFHNAKVATAIFPDIHDEAVRGMPDFARTLVVLAGVMLLVQAAPRVINIVLVFISVRGSGSISPDQLIPTFIGSLVPIGAGIYLIARPGRLLEYLQRPLREEIVDDE